MKNLFRKLGLVSASVVLLFACSTGGNQDFPGDDITNDNLSKIENDEYELYYPNYYEKYDNTLQAESYKSMSINELGGGNNIGLNTQDGDEKGTKPTDQECQDMADQFVEELGLGDVDYAEVVNEGGMYGCYVQVTMSVQEIQFVSETRTLVKQNEENAKVYAVNITYDKTADAKEIKDLKDALAKFKIL